MQNELHVWNQFNSRYIQKLHVYVTSFTTNAKWTTWMKPVLQQTQTEATHKKPVFTGYADRI